MASFFPQKAYATCVALETDVPFVPNGKKERERETERQRDRETERQRESERERERETEGERERESERALYIALELRGNRSLRHGCAWEGVED